MATTSEPVSTAAPPEPATTASEPEPDLAVTLPTLALEVTSPDLARHPTSPLALAEEEAADELAHHPTTPLTADQQARAPEDSTLQVPPQPTQAAPLPVFTHASVSSVPPPPRQPVGAMRQGNARLARRGDGELPRSTPLPAEKQRRRLRRIYRLQYFSRKHLRRARAQDRRDRRRLWTTIWSTTTTLFLLFLALGGVAGYIAYNFIVATQGTYAGQVLTLRDLLPPDNLKIYDSQGRLIDQMTDQGIHTEIPYKQIAPDLLNATVAIEDHTFWQNQGVDIMGILRAAIADLNSQQQVQGGSTITQQLIKKLVVGDSDDIKRKLSELVLAPQVNNHYSKQDILEMYVNTIYYGHQAYGIEAAATVYFGLVNTDGRSAASQLDLAQAAFLAGLPRNASLYDPAVNTEAAYQRFSDVLQAMVAQHYITQVQAQTAYQEGTAPDFFKSSPTLIDQAPHFDEYVLSQLEQLYHLSRAQLSRSGLIVYTTLDVELQHKILKIMQQHIAEIRDAHHVTNAAEVLIDFHTGAIISMLGSIDYYDKAIDGQYNVALAYRQPGSSFKPYVYVTAFAQGASPAQAVDDASTTFQVPDSNPPTYTPSNYDEHFHGHMTLRCALQNSLNVPAVRVLQHVGIANSMNTAKAMGITTYEGTPGLSLVLGGLDVRLLDHTSAYGVFANGGVRQPYYSISKIIKSTTGKVLLQHQTTPGVQVLTPQLAYMMTSVLSDNTSRLPEFFDCNVLQLYANSQQDCYNGNRGQVRPAAAKTGTTQDFRDNWTVGYTTDFVMGVWAGNDDNSPMINVTGVQGAAPIWHDAMLLAEQGHPIRDFQNPGGLERATVTYADGVKSTDWFLPGTVPHNSTTPGHPDPAPASSTPYCSTFSFAFPPPAGSGIPANGAWW
ncbi:MAG TPA: transglycosylase domain-containing protein [Ktedonobacteraceae bacterium]|nr:transglycosylase domain-containing protein [Ktedonobacteraceae bacterium]